MSLDFFSEDTEDMTFVLASYRYSVNQIMLSFDSKAYYYRFFTLTFIINILILFKQSYPFKHIELCEIQLYEMVIFLWEGVKMILIPIELSYPY